jgi:excinuclease ABC subunit A
VFDDRAAVIESSDAIHIHGAREHNLKNLSLSIPRNCFVVVTGVSGSGKSTLAFDLLFAEGQRRFLDSMSLYARQFVEQLSRPEVDLITGIPPTVSIEQRNSRGGGKSTVATVTEIYHFLRLLFARLGTQFCPECDLPVETQTRDELGRRLQKDVRARGELWLLAPVVRNRKGFHSDVAEWAFRHGYTQIRADGKIVPASERLRLDRFREHDVEIVTGRLGKKRVFSARTENPKTVKAQEVVMGLVKSGQELVDETLKLGNGTLFALDDCGRISVHSVERSCPKCRRSFSPLDPKNFSYNSSQGWCPRCRGFGELFYLPDVERGARAEAIEESWYQWQEGNREVCPDCKGARLNPVALAVRLRLGGLELHSLAVRRQFPGIHTFSEMTVEDAFKLFKKLKLKSRAAVIGRDILPEIRERLKFLCEVGLGYLQLGRGVPTLSGGESQRIRLSAQLGSNLSGVLYILDEPTIGLHARDNKQLLAALQKLKVRGNSVLVVEHDEETMRQADYIIDLGPKAGVHGGQLVASGTLADLLRHPESITGKCLRSKKKYPSQGQRRPVVANRGGLGNLVLARAARNNLKDLTVRFPLGRLVLVTGVSGSGKSTLIRECLLPTIKEALDKPARQTKNRGGKTTRVTGFEALKSVYEVDQSPIGRTPRSVPATYIGFFDHIRQLFAQIPESRLRGYSPSRFSFNSVQGRCPACEGSGSIKLEMNFLPPAFVRCETCGGTRFNRETLDIEYRHKSIAQVLELSVDEAMDFFSSVPKIKRPLQALCDTGLGYLKLGQTSPTLSGGEAQRVKLVSHLLAGFREPDLFDRQSRGNLFILEEPTIGLHMADVQRLVDVLQRLVNIGHSVLVIEHNLDVIAEADWVIDLGPEGGAAGGRIVAEGTPEQVAKNQNSYTGRFLRDVLSLT